MIEYLEHISIDPNIRFGKPCIKGTRISVYDILKMLANGLNISEVQDDFPELTKDQILSCLSYAANREHKIKVAS
jgi:uncharacterized protein (DUF433 family)